MFFSAANPFEHLQIAGAVEEVRFLHDHIHALRQHPGLRRAQFIFCPEKIPGHDVGHLYEAIRNEFNMTTVWKEVNAAGEGIGDPGFRTTGAAVKVRWANATRHNIMGCHILPGDQMVCANAWLPAETRWKTTWEKLQRQMRAYRAVRLTPDNPSSQGNYSISGVLGKYDKRDKSRNDDLIDAFAMGNFMIQLLINKEMPNFDHRHVPV